MTMNESTQQTVWRLILEKINERLASGKRGEHSKLARELGITTGTLSKWINKDLSGDRISFEQVIQVTRKLNIDLSGLLLGEAVLINRELPPDLGGVPTIGLAACGYDWCTGERLSTMSPRPGDQKFNEDLFAVMAIGESLKPAGVEPGFVVYCDPRASVDIDDMVFVERNNGTMSLKIFRGIDGIWVVLEGWLPPDSKGIQKMYTLREDTAKVKRIVPVVYIRRKM